MIAQSSLPKRNKASNDAIVLALFLPTRRSITLLIKLINYLEEIFIDCDIYIGINPSIYEFIGLEIIKKSKLNIRYMQVDVRLDAKSDSSAFQAALLLMKQANFNYDIVYFMHLKGSSLEEEYKIVKDGKIVELNFLEFFMDVFKKREYIQRVFEDDNSIGTYSYMLGKSKNKTKDVTSMLMDFEYPPFYSYIHFYTFFAARGTAIKNIIENCKSEFWNNNLTELSDRYFFERDFNQMIWRQGFIPKFEVFTNVNDGYDLTYEEFSSDINNYFNKN
jgi:hypothetical protein